jgi:hypothetical protein
MAGSSRLETLEAGIIFITGLKFSSTVPILVNIHHKRQIT